MCRITSLVAGIAFLVIQSANAWAANVVIRWVEQGLDTVRADNRSTIQESVVSEVSRI